MPVIIVDNNGGKTSVENGTIQMADLQSMSNDYINQVALAPIPPRNVIVKRYSFYFTKEQLLALFDQYKDKPNANAIEIALGIQVPGTIVLCNNKTIEFDNSNCLGVIISMADKDSLNNFNQVNDHVLINGYNPSSAENFLIDKCCPGSKPPPPYK